MLMAKDRNLYTFNHSERKNSTIDMLHNLVKGGKTTTWTEYQNPKPAEQKSQESLSTKEPKALGSGPLPEPTLKHSDSANYISQGMSMKIIGKKIK